MISEIAERTLENSLKVEAWKKDEEILERKGFDLIFEKGNSF